MSKESLAPERPKWDAAYLVCKACGKRRNAPKDAKPKAVASAVRHAAKNERPRARVVMTSCLGLCPKGATAVARVGGPTPSRIVAVESHKHLEAVIAAMGVVVVTTPVVAIDSIPVPQA